MTPKITTWALALGSAIVFAASCTLDGPTDAELEQALAADLADAQVQAQHISKLTRKCHLLRGPTAELMQIRDTDDYVCRAAEIEPLPAEVLHRYANLGLGVRP